MNPFKVGDKVRCIDVDVFWLYGKEFIVTEVDIFFITFESNIILPNGKKYKCKQDSAHHAYFELVRSAEQIALDKILNEGKNEKEE